MSQYTLYRANLGDAYRWSGKPAKATEAYEEAVRLATDHLALNPRDPLEHRTIAICYAKLGNSKLANEHIETALQIDPQDVSGLYRAATIANIGGDAGKAVKLLEAALARGYSRSEVARDPEFANLRKNGTISQLFSNRP
jgi:Flp pilus assembly protein TadD